MEQTHKQSDRRMLGYVRAPSEEAKESLTAQEAAVRAECKRRGWTLVDIVREEGEDEQRALLSALDQIDRGEVSGLVVVTLDSLSRSVRRFARLLEWFAEHEDATLVILDVGIDTSTAGGRRIVNAFASLAHSERNTTAERIRARLAEARAEGRRIGRPAVADLPELRERIARMRADGMTLETIARIFNAEGIPTLRGGKRWRHSSIQAAAGYRRPRATAGTPPTPSP